MGLFGAKLSEVLCIFFFTLSRKNAYKVHNIRMEQFGGVFCSLSVITLFSFIPFIDWAGHIGGFCAGFFIGMIIFSSQIESRLCRLLWGVAGFLSMILFFVGGLIQLYTVVEPDESLADVCQYYRAYYYEGYECICSANM